MSKLPSQMQALVLETAGGGYTGNKGFVARQVPTPTLDEKKSPSDSEQVLLKTIYGGFCGSDKGLWFRNAFGDLITKTLDREKKSWRVPGHEFLGQIVEMGSAARENYGLRPGDVVSTESHIYCGKCFQCKHGEQHVCQETEIIGFSRDGCFAEYVKLPANVLWKTDTDKIRPEVAALQEPLGNAVHVCSTVDLKDKTVLVSGCGTIGLFALLIARNMGARTIIGVDSNPQQLEIAKRLGADKTIPLKIDKSQSPHASSHELVRVVHELTQGVGVDVAMEMAGFNNSVNNSIQCTRKGGDVILFGIKAGDFVIEKYEGIILDGKTLHSIVGRRVFDTWKLTKSLLETKPEIQKKIYEVILNGGKETILPIGDFTPNKLESAIQQHIKVLISFNA